MHDIDTEIDVSVGQSLKTRVSIYYMLVFEKIDISTTGGGVGGGMDSAEYIVKAVSWLTVLIC